MNCSKCNEAATLKRDGVPLCESHYGSMIMVHDIIEDNGKSIRENRSEVPHKIAIGTLVEVKYDEWFGEGASQKVHARLWVAKHTRDCDGTPLYTLSSHRYPFEELTREMIAAWCKSGFCESRLTPIEVTPDLIYGHGALQWTDVNP